MNKKNQFLKFGITCLGYKSQQDLIENLYIKSIYDSYNRIHKSIGIENEIRDRFIYDFYYKSPYLKKLIQTNILFVNWERWVFKNESDLGRTDLSFAISGFEYVVECKRLKDASQKYVDEGLMRFINEDYSKNESYVGMIGFIISSKIENIYSKLEDKCLNKYYLDNDFSKKKIIYGKYSFTSSHSRVNKNPINVYHLFFKFNKN